MMRQLIAICIGALFFHAGACADEWPDWLSLHVQSTFIDQYHPAFHSPYRGSNSMAPQSAGDETFDATMFVGARLWHGGAVYFDPEILQGFGLSNTLGAAGFPNGEGSKVGKSNPYFRPQRLYFQQSIDLGGERQKVDDDLNQVGDTQTADNLVITLGKFAVGDIFDVNAYAHDPRHDFLNWALISGGAFDYAADAWGYASGAALEWTQSWWTLRFGAFNLSKVPNGEVLETNFRQFELVTEVEERHTLFGHDGKVKLLGFLNRGRMGDYRNAIALGDITHTTPDTSLVRRYASRPGGEINLEQGLTGDLGLFLRASANDGSKEAYEYTEINKSLSAGLSLSGALWDRENDTVGVAGVVNGLSRSARDYFAAGGIGILIGDGRLPHYGTEDIAETYYAANIARWLTTTLDYQFVANPAYNRDRGPISIFALRLHAQM